MSKKPVEVLNIGFNEALQRIAKFDKEKLPVDNKVDEVKKSKKTKPIPSKPNNRKGYFKENNLNTILNNA